MKRLGIAMLLAVVVLSGVCAALAYDSPPTTDPDPIETP
jgi:hypothetical protein